MFFAFNITQKRNLKLMEIREMDDLNYRKSFELQNIAKNLSKLEYLAFQQKPTKSFIDNFLLKLSNLKYFSFQTPIMFKAIYDYDNRLIDFFAQNLPFPVQKRKLTAQGRPISPDCKMYSKELCMFSQNYIDETYFGDAVTTLFVKKYSK